MSLKYADVVYREDERFDFVWCEYQARMHTVVDVHYRITAFLAREELAPDAVYRKGKRLKSSKWRETPRECREDLRRELGVSLDSKRIAWEKSFSIGISVSEEF